MAYSSSRAFSAGRATPTRSVFSSAAAAASIHHGVPLQEGKKRRLPPRPGFVEGQSSMVVRIVVAWIMGALLALGGFDHVIVATLEQVFGTRFAPAISCGFVRGNFDLPAPG